MSAVPHAAGSRSSGKRPALREARVVPLARGMLLALVTLTLAAAAEARPGKLVIGERLSLWELVRPDRFGWPALFRCRREPKDRHPVVIAAHDPNELNRRLSEAGIWPQDCRGGFSIHSIGRHPGKLELILGEVRRSGSKTSGAPSRDRNR
jgi:hypothetical protein